MAAGENIISIDYKDWLMCQKRLPDKASAEYSEFFEFHKSLALDGFMMNGTYINPFLYWHLNMWHTDVDVIDEKGRIYQKYTNPTLRDNEWILTEGVHNANLEKKGLVILGIRRFSKTTFEGSYIGWGATFDENSQNVIAGLNAPDIKLITDKLDKGLNFLPEYYQWQRIEDNWKNQVTLGIKTRGGKRMPFSYIMIRNLDEGNNEEAIAGTKPRKLIIDEIGKGSFLRALKAAEPGFTTPFGWGCSPILTGTGGDMKKFMDAKSLMFDVHSFNFLEYKNNIDARRIHGFFIGHKYRMEAKVQSSLGAYIDNPALMDIPMMVSDETLADKITDGNLEKARRSNDRSTYRKEKMYYPKVVDDIFLNEDDNIFDIELAQKQKARILAVERTGVPVILSHDGEKIIHSFTDKLPITNYPLKNSESKDAPVVIYEFPVSDIPFGLYILGVDSYRQGNAKYSDSLGAGYVYKRMHSLTGESYQDMIVASYVARTNKKEDWDEQMRLLAKYYNARVVCENDEISFIEYMKSKGDAHMLVKMSEMHFIKEIVPNTSVDREYGVHRSVDKIREYLHKCFKKYMEETIYKEVDPITGSVVKEIYGVTRILDPMLLEEVIQYNEDGNFDRIIAAELAITYAMQLGPILGKAGNSDANNRLYKPKSYSHSLLQKGSAVFRNSKKFKLFT